MTWEDLKKFNTSALSTIVGQTHKHPMLSFLYFERLFLEIIECLDLLKLKGEILTIHFSFSEGQLNRHDKM